jgi:hypothetical protein
VDIHTRPSPHFGDKRVDRENKGDAGLALCRSVYSNSLAFYAISLRVKNKGGGWRVAG